MMKKQRLPSWVRRPWAGLFLMAFSILAKGAYAQSVPDLAGLTSATPDGDWSMRLWVSLLGSFAENPFTTLGGPTTLLGGVFVIFNSCMFVLGFTWALYGIVSAVAGTANEGEALGRRMSTIWFPIRMIIGIAGMVPVFGGFTLAQAIMMFLTTIGIGIGNTMWTGAVNNTNQMQGLMNTQTISPTGTTHMRAAARSMFTSNVCVIAQGDHVRSLGARAGAGEQIRISSVTVGNVSSYKYGSVDDPEKCGSVSIETNARSTSSALAFRSGAVNYSAIESVANQAYVTGLGRLQTTISNLATNWYQQRRSAIDAATELPRYPLDEVEAAVDTFGRETAAAITRSIRNTGSVNDDVRANMLAVGWFGAGAWSSTFAEVNAGIADAARGPTPKYQSNGGLLTTRADDTLKAVAASEMAYETALSARAVTGTGDPVKTLVDSAIRDSGCGGSTLNSVAGTATGNCSFGQAIVSAAIRGTAIGSGGGGNGQGSVGFDSEGFVNPIIMMKNMGDYVMTASSTILLGGGVMWVAEKLGIGGPAARVASMATDMVGKVTGGDDDGSMFAVIKTVAMVTLVLGAAMSVYIPLVPFITWIGAILAYAASMIEGFAGATLHSMAHLDGDGDGLGQRTTHGYMFYINAVARPALMIIGFFVASALMIAIGTLLAQMILPAMANAQGNSVTGLFSIAMFLVVFFVMNLTLITASHNLIYVITDQVIGFIGGQIDSRLGRDTEDKVNNMFLMAARVGPSAIGQAGAAKGAAKTDFARRLAGAGKDKPKSSISG